MKTKKRHHYLPQFYLEYFTNSEGIFWIYDREKREYRQQKPLNTAVVGHYYHFVETIPNNDVDIEEYLALVETLTKPIIEKLNKRLKINIEEMKTITYFIALMKVRVPRFQKVLNITYKNHFITSILETFNSEEKVSKLLREMETDTGEKLNIKPDDFIKVLQNGQINIDDYRDGSLLAMAPAAYDISKRIFSMTWTILFCNDACSFITSDNPFAVIKPVNDISLPKDASKLLFQFTQVLFPLSSSTCILIDDSNRNNHYMNASRNAVREINIITAKNSERFVISRDEALIRNIIEKAQITMERKD